MTTWPGLLTALAMVVAFDAALILGDPPKPDAVTVTRDPMGAPSRAAPRGTAPAGSTASNEAPVVTCNTPAPSPTWTCQNGAWVMVPTSATTGTGSPTANSPDGGAGNCLGVQPGAGWSCRGGAWTPPGSASPASTATPPAAVAAPIWRHLRHNLHHLYKASPCGRPDGLCGTEPCRRRAGPRREMRERHVGVRFVVI